MNPLDDVTIEHQATYATAGGKRIQVLSETDEDENTTDYVWECPGCKTGIPSADRPNRAAALAGAQAHAKKCTAI